MHMAREQPVVLTRFGDGLGRVNARRLQACCEPPLLFVLTCDLEAFAALAVHGERIFVVALHAGESPSELPSVLRERRRSKSNEA